MVQLFLKVLNMGITAGYCVLIVLFLRLLLRRMPKIYSYVLWSVVWFRLVCPLSIKSVLSLIKISTRTIPMDIGRRETPAIDSGSARVDAVVNAGIRQMIPQAAVGDSVNPMQIVLFVAGVVWILVAAFLFFYSLWSVFRLKRQLTDARWVEEKLYEAENLCTPFVLGFFKPCIYLPAGLEGQERVYVLAHERTHIKRKDYLIKQAAFLVTCVYWFHPLIWLAFYLMCRDMEMSCDESVIRKMGGEIKKEYSAALLSLASGRRIVNGSPLAFGEGGIRARITNVLRYKRPGFWASILFIVVLAAILLGLALNPKEKPDDQSGEMPEKVVKSTLETEAESFEQAVRYQGYLDESPYTFWNQDWNDCDFDGDGKRDRVYRGVTEDGISYRIDFGDGSVLEIGEFEDFFTGLTLETADVTEDGTPEILFVGMHMACTDPYDMSEIALFSRKDGTYERLPLPVPSHAKEYGYSPYAVGFDINAYNRGEDRMELSCPDAGYEEMFRLTGDTFLDIYAADPYALAGECAFDADFISYEGENCLALYENIGGKWLYQPVRFVLAMEMEDASGEFNLDNIRDVGLVETEETAGLETETADARGTAADARGTAADVLETAADISEYQETKLRLYVPESVQSTGYVDLKGMPEEYYADYARQAMKELYELTGTQEEECCYYYTKLGSFVFALTEEDLEHDRIFYSRSFGSGDMTEFSAISSVYISYARRCWYSPVYQYQLPPDFDSYEDSEKAVWFLKQSGIYNGKGAVKCTQPYSAMPETWRIVMEDGTAYEVSLDTEIDGVSNITGPYPDEDINH